MKNIHLQLRYLIGQIESAMIQVYEVVDISQGQRPSEYSLPRVDNHGIQWRGVCNNILYTYTESVESKKVRRKECLAGFEPAA